MTDHKLRAYLRCDASASIGAGHVIRCLTLANRLRARGWLCSFLSNDEMAACVPAVGEEGFDILHADTEPQDADLLIVDHYGLDAAYERQAKSWARACLVIDDITDRPHDCDYLVNHATLSLQEKEQARAQVNDECVCFLGPEYTFLRPDFLTPPSRAIQRPPQRVHLFFGTSDVARLTLRVLEAIIALGLHDTYDFDVVIGKGHPQHEELKRLCEMHERCHLHVQVKDMAQIMRRCDLAIGSGGGALWEKLALGIPCADIAHSANQIPTLEMLDDMGVIAYWGRSVDMDDSTLSNKIKNSLRANEKFKKIGVGNEANTVISEVESRLKKYSKSL